MSLDGEPLYFVQNWNNKIGIIDGKDIFLFDEMSSSDSDLLYNVYWGNPGGASNNEPIVNGGIHTSGQINADNVISTFYNYPNPISNSMTTFRFFSEDADRSEIKIYTVSGSLVDSIEKDYLDSGEYNEMMWQSNNNSSGLYLAKLVVFSNGESIDTKIIKIIIPRDD